MELENCIQALALELNLEGLAMRANDTLSVGIGDNLSVTIEVMREQSVVLVYAELGHVHEQDRLVLYEQMLRANLFGLTTGDATLCLDDQTGRIVLYRKLLLASIEPAGFVADWFRLVGVAIAWQDRLSGEDIRNDASVRHEPSEAWIGV